MYTFRPTYIYRAYDAAASLLYLGISNDPEKRFRGGHRLHSLWYADIADLTLTRYETSAAAELAETQAIGKERPLWNVADSADWTASLNRKRELAAKARVAAPGHWDVVCSLIKCAKAEADEPARLWRLEHADMLEAERLRKCLQVHEEHAWALFEPGQCAAIAALLREQIQAAEERAQRATSMTGSSCCPPTARDGRPASTAGGC